LFAMPSEGTPKDDPPATALFAADQAYVLFGLAEDATWEDVVRAHRKLAKRYHPDALINEPPEVRSKGEERMRELNVAYESLRRTFHPPTRSLF